MKSAHLKRLSAVLLLLAMLFSLAACGKEETQLEKTARYLQAQVPEPTCSAVGGDWLVFALARSGVKVPQKYFDTYYKNTEDYAASVDGVLSRKKNTEYSRAVLALTAIGKDPRNVAGFDLLLSLADLQEPNGAYTSWGEENSESVSQVIVALTELGISPDDERFVKNGQTLEQVLLRFAQEDGSFRHTADGKSDEMATEQALYALAAISRAQDGRTTLYDMTDTAQ